MNKFNLTFSGEILSGFQPDEAKQDFAQLFNIDNAERIERFFSGETITLRRNLERKAAAETFQQMRAIGLVSELVKVLPEETAKESGVFQGRTGENPLTPATNSPRGLDEPAQIHSANKARQEKQARKEKRDAEKARKREEAQRQKAEKKAAKLAAKEEERQKREEAKALQAQEKQRRAEEEARRKAEEEARNKAEAEALARRKAEEAERERLQKEQAQRLAAEAAEQAHQEAIEAKAQAERLALEKAQRQEELLRAAQLKASLEREQAEQEKRRAEEERQRVEQERKTAESERKKAESERKRLELAQQKALEEQRKADAAKAQRKAEEKARSEVLNAIRERARQEESAQLPLIQEATRKAEAAKTAAEEANHAAAKEEAGRQRILGQVQREQAETKQANERAGLEENAINRGAAELARGTGLKAQKNRVKTRMEVPLRDTNRSDNSTSPVRRKRQAGEPNLYSLNAFRVNQSIRERARTANSSARKYTLISLCAALVVFAVVVIKARIPIPQPILGADAVAASASGTLSILSSKRIFQHDRAGNETGEISLTALGFGAVEPILAYTPGNNLLIREAKAADTQIGAQEDPLWRCDLETSKCVSVSGNLQGIEVSAFTPHELDGSLFVADASSKELLRINPEGEVISRAAINMPGKPVLNLQSGLLFMNSAEGPAVSVFRYEAQAFGKQLDEVLLLPPSAVNAQHTRVWDFVYNKDHWWVVMYDPDSGNAGIYRFDSQWNFQNQLPVATTTLPLQLIRWGEKVLVNTKRSSSLQRFNSEGIAEAPLESKALSKRIADTEQRARLLGKGTKLALTLAFGALIVALALLYLQRTRALVYKSQNERGAEPVDEHADNLDWIAPAKDRTRTLKQRLVSYTLLIVATAFLGISVELPSNTLVALLAFLAGPGCALGIMLRRPIGHIGTLTPRLLLVDPAGTYHLGGGSQLQYRGNFLLLNDVVVFTGNSIFPAFAREQVKQLVLPMTKGGVKIDWKTLLIKLLESRHPVALAGLSVLASWGIAVIALLALA